MGHLNNINQQPLVQELGGLFMSVTGGAVFYVGTAAQLQSFSDAGAGIASRSFSTVNLALAACVSGRGDTIYILPGYTENIAGANAWSGLAGTDITIVGMGRGTNRPAFTWTANGATLLMNQANFKIFNCQMFLAGPQVNGSALTVAAPITVSAAGCEISSCEIWWGFDADQIVTIGITTTAAADNFKFNRNRCYAETAAVPTTTFLRLTGADNIEIDGTHIIGPGSTTAIGPVQQTTTGCLKAYIHDSNFQNTLASSTISFTVASGNTGIVDKCSFGVLASGNGLTAASGLQVNNSWTAVAGAAGVATTG